MSLPDTDPEEMSPLHSMVSVTSGLPVVQAKREVCQGPFLGHARGLRGHIRHQDHRFRGLARGHLWGQFVLSDPTVGFSVSRGTGKQSRLPGLLASEAEAEGPTTGTCSALCASLKIPWELAMREAGRGLGLYLQEVGAWRSPWPAPLLTGRSPVPLSSGTSGLFWQERCLFFLCPLPNWSQC